MLCMEWHSDISVLLIFIPPLNQVERGLYSNRIVHLSVQPSVTRPELHHVVAMFILKDVCPSIHLWTQPCYHSAGCDFSPIIVKLCRDIPWVKISAEFIHGRHGSFNECLTSYLLWPTKLVNVLLGAILLWLWSNLIVIYLGSRSRPSSFIGDIDLLMSA